MGLGLLAPPSSCLPRRVLKLVGCVAFGRGADPSRRCRQLECRLWPSGILGNLSALGGQVPGERQVTFAIAT